MPPRLNCVSSLSYMRSFSSGLKKSFGCFGVSLSCFCFSFSVCFFEFLALRFLVLNFRLFVFSVQCQKIVFLSFLLDFSFFQFLF